MDRPLTKEDLALPSLEPEPLDVHDLPQIHTKPTARVLLDTLSLLSVESRSWEVTPPRTPGRGTPRGVSGVSTPLRPPRRKVRAEGVPQYLTKIVSSQLGWIEDEDQKEKIWDTASARLSERSGRTAMGAFTRSFAVPLDPPPASADDVPVCGDDDMQVYGPDEAKEISCVEISIHEPALTADNLGLKTWAASYVMARRWPTLAQRVSAIKRCIPHEDGHDLMLELGAGTGLVGLAAAAVLGVNVLMTDLPMIASNLARNTNDNAAVISQRGGKGDVAILDWSEPGTVTKVQLDNSRLDKFEEPIAFVKHDSAVVNGTSGSGLGALVIVAADPIYSMEHPSLLANAVSYHLSDDPEAAVLVGLPIREAYVTERAEFRKHMAGIGLRLVSEESDVGLDDWSEGKDDEPSEVECSITIWMRK